MIITRVFSVEIEPFLRNEFESEFSSISFCIVKNSAGGIQTAILQPTRWQPNRYAMSSEWDDKSSLISFVGKNWNVAVIPVEIEMYARKYSVDPYLSWVRISDRGCVELRTVWIIIKMKKKLTAAQKRAKAERQKKYEWIFMNGKRVRVKRPEMIEGMLVEDFIAENADDIWLTQHGMYDVLYAREMERDRIDNGMSDESEVTDIQNCYDSEIPF